MMNNQLNLILDNRLPVLVEEKFGKSVLSASLANLQGKKVIFRTDFAKEQIPLQSLSQATLAKVPYAPIPFSLSPKNRLVASIDSSCALIGETEEGSIYAGRVATVFATKGSIQKFYRVGPMIFYLDQAAIQSGLAPNRNKALSVLLLDRSIAERLIRIYLERRAQIEAANSLSQGLLVVDGSLRMSLLEQNGETLRDLQKTCRENSNELIGISKSSSLRIISNIGSILQSSDIGQGFIDVTTSVRALFPRIGSNKITLAKFSKNSSIFRVDFSSSNVEEESQLFSDLKHNDSFFRGYPETLRLAHHLSVFDSSTIASVRSYLAKHFGLVQVPSDDLRATILGKFV